MTTSNLLLTDVIYNNILLKDIDIPVNDYLISTSLTLNTASPSNNDILPTYESVDTIPNINIGSGSIFSSDYNLLPRFTGIDELLVYLSQVMIRFNSNPNYYMQDDFALLIKTITNALIDLYLKTPISDNQLTELVNLIVNKVDKVEGKGLSTNDLTDELKLLYDTAYEFTHSHTNKEALDLVSGINTGDQDLAPYELITNNDIKLEGKENIGVAAQLISEIPLIDLSSKEDVGIAQSLVTNLSQEIDLEFINVREELLIIDAIARGRSRAIAFNTQSEMTDWLLIQTNVDTLLMGDNFYIRELDVPDYWWDATNQIPQILESEKVDLTNVVFKEEGKSLVLDTEIAKIHEQGTDIQDLSNLVEKNGTDRLITQKEVIIISNQSNINTGDEIYVGINTPIGNEKYWFDTTDIIFDRETIITDNNELIKA